MKEETIKIEWQMHCSWNEQQKMAIETIFVQKSAFKKQSTKNDSHFNNRWSSYSLLSCTFIWNGNPTNSPLFFSYTSEKLKIAKKCSECIFCSDTKYGQNLIHILGSGCKSKFFFLSIVSCHKAPLIYQLALRCVQYSHYKSCFTPFRRIKPSAFLDCARNCEVLRLLLIRILQNSRWKQLDAMSTEHPINVFQMHTTTIFYVVVKGTILLMLQNM